MHPTSEMATHHGLYEKRRSEDYDDVHDMHDEHSNDAGESLMGHGMAPKSWDELRHVPRPGRNVWRSCCSSSLLQSLLNTVLLVLVLALLVDRRGHQDRPGQLEASGDMTGFIPPVAQQIKTFVPDWSFAPENSSDFFSDEVQDKWLSIVPKGLGYLQVPDPSRYSNLPHPLEGYEHTVFTTSVTHQLHCLYNIMEVYSSMTSGLDIPDQMHGHLPHCFEYLRQSIMCAGDTALEGQHTTFPQGILGSDGWDAKHVCKDYSAVYEFLEKHRADDQVWI